MNGEEETSLVPIPERLKARLEVWKKLRETREVADMYLERGFQIPWIGRWVGWERPFTPINQAGMSSPATAEEAATLREELKELLELGVVEEVRRGGRLPFISPYQARPKKGGGGLRAILDAMKLNQLLDPPPRFRMETLDTALPLIQRGSWLCKVDISKAYYHVGLDKRSMKVTAFQCEGKTYMYRGLPMGLSWSPYVFTRVVNSVIHVLRTKGFGVREMDGGKSMSIYLDPSADPLVLVVFVDDVLVISDTEGQARREVQVVIAVLRLYGFKVNDKKCVVTPTHIITFLGFDVDSARMMLKVTEEKRKNILAEVRSVIRKGKVKSLKELARIIGLCISIRPVVKEASLYLYQMQKWRDALLGPVSSTTSRWQMRGRWNRSLEVQEARVPQEVMMEMKWWEERLVRGPVEISFTRQDSSFMVTSDASEWGWGATLHKKMKGQWELMATASEPWGKMAASSISPLELQAGVNAISLWRKMVERAERTRVRWRSDNMSVVCGVRAWRTMRPEMHSRLCVLHRLVQEMKVELEMEHIPGVENGEADQLSRRGLMRAVGLTSYWTMNPITFTWLCTKLNFVPTVQALVRAPENVLVERGWTEEETWVREWAGEKVMAYPGIGKPLLRFLAFLRATRRTAMLIMPLWTSQIGWCLMKKMEVAPGVVLRDREDRPLHLLIQGRMGKGWKPWWNLYATVVSGHPRKK